MKIWNALAMCAVLAGCGGIHPEKYAAEMPIFNPITFLTGEVQGQGIIYNWRGKVLETYGITMTGVPQDDGSLEVTEDYTFADGSKKLDTLTYAQTGENIYTSVSPLFPEGAKAKGHGNLVNWRYRYQVPFRNGHVWVNIDDKTWLMQDGETVFDEITMRKFGFKVGRVVMILKRV